MAMSLYKLKVRSSLCGYLLRETLKERTSEKYYDGIFSTMECLILARVLDNQLKG
jgi:hypothetical protein